jgi:hypothetical protein
MDDIGMPSLHEVIRLEKMGNARELFSQGRTTWIVLAAICASGRGAVFLAADAFAPIIDVFMLEPDHGRKFHQIFHLPAYETLRAVNARASEQLEKPGKAKDASLVYYFLAGLQEFGECFASWVVFPGVVVGFAGFSLDVSCKWLRRRRQQVKSRAL